jgi:alkylation response protein AidB-like acyl-CoA dehydrogenase
MLGACDALLNLAVEHAEQREQFGQPLAGFQAVQHLLAESHIELTALREMCHALLASRQRPWPGLEATELTKLWAGRCGPRIARRSLQVLGAIGFTEEHPHHRYLRRVQTLGAVLGNREALARCRGRALVESGSSSRGLEIAELLQGDESST